MITVLTTYKLKKGVDINDFKKYFLIEDKPYMTSFDFIIDMAAYIVEGQDKEIDIFEVIFIKSLEDWEKLLKPPYPPQLEKNIHTFYDKLCDKETQKTFYGQVVEE